MKKNILLSTLMTAVVCLTTGYAQKSKVISAYNYLKYGELDKAKEAIDAASSNEQTKGMAKTWYYKAKVYQAIATSQDEKYKSLSEDPYTVAYESYLKAKEIPSKKIDANELDQGLKIVANLLFTAGVDKYNAKKFPEALAFFEKSIEANSKFQIVDSLASFNAALSADQGGDPAKALQYYNKCKEIGYGGAGVYGSLANLYLNQQKEQLALNILNEGRQKFPENQSLITTLINIYLKKNQSDSALQNLNLAIQGSPENAVLYYARGTIFNEKSKFELAEADYKKAVELKTGYFDALYNLGALYFNKGADLFNQSNNLPLHEARKAQSLKGEATTEFEKALPYLEQAYALNPNDQSTMTSLMSIYARTNNQDKYQQIKDKLRN